MNLQQLMKKIVPFLLLASCSVNVNTKSSLKSMVIGYEHSCKIEAMEKIKDLDEKYNIKDIDHHNLILSGLILICFNKKVL